MEKENYFKKLNTIAGEVEKKNNLSYISWATAWEMTKKEFPDANYTIYENQDGNAFWETKFGIDVKVGVTINGIEHIVRLPVMDGANNAMTDKEQKYNVLKNVYQYGKLVYENNKPKKEEVEVIIAPATQFDINKAIQRAFTKAMAMHGIGLYVYRGEDLPEQEPKEFGEENYKGFLARKGDYKTAQEAIDIIKTVYTLSSHYEEQIKLLYK